MARGATWCMRMATRASLAVRPLIRAVSIHADQISANDDYLVGEIYLVIDCSLQNSILVGGALDPATVYALSSMVHAMVRTYT